jgi:putative acetyltransferase
MNVTIREERAEDSDAIRGIHTTAFGTDAEARLVDALRAARALTLSLVAEVDGRIVGHIGFSPVTVSSDDRVHVGVGLAPMAVLPSFRRNGIGAAVVLNGLERLRSHNDAFCVVLGHAKYYPRFGFKRASTLGMHWERKGHEDSFFVQALRPGGLDGVKGVVRYRPEFDGL